MDGLLFIILGLAGFAVDPAAAGQSPIVEPSEPKPPAVVLAYQYPEYLEGSIYAQGAEPKRLLYRFKRVAARSGSTLSVDREFTYPDGRIAAREHVVYHGNSLATYELDELQIGARGAATIKPAAAGGQTIIEFQYGPSSGERTKPHAETLAGVALISDMVGPFLAAHWDSLMRGDKVRCRYIVVQRKETVGFTFAKVAESSADTARTITVRMEPTSAVLGLLVRPLFFTIEKSSPHRVLRYAGRTTPKIKSGNKWEDLDALTVFDWPSAH